MVGGEGVKQETQLQLEERRKKLRQNQSDIQLVLKKCGEKITWKEVSLGKHAEDLRRNPQRRLLL